MCVNWNFYLDILCTFMIRTYETFASGCKCRQRNDKNREENLKVKVFLCRVGAGYLINIGGFLVVCFTNRDTEKEENYAFFLFCLIVIFAVCFYDFITFILVYNVCTSATNEQSLEGYMMVYRCLEIIFDIMVLIYSFIFSEWEMTEFTTATTVLSCSDIGLNFLMLMKNCIGYHNPYEESQGSTSIEDEENRNQNEDGVRFQRMDCVHDIFKLKCGNLTIKVERGNITRKKVDVIAITTTPDFNLNTGVLSKSILQAAGDEIQVACNKKRTHHPKGDILEVDGLKLPCNKVYFGSILDRKSDGSIDALRDFVDKCLKTANDSFNKCDIAFPTLGTGSLGFPVNEMSETLISCFVKFAKTTAHTKIKHIYVIVYEGGPQMQDELNALTEQLRKNKDAFKEEKGERKGKTKTKQTYDNKAYKSDRHDGTNLQDLILIKQGDITDYKVDVIVSTAAKNLDLGSQNMSSAILKKAGKEKIQNKCQEDYPDGIGAKNLAILPGFALKSRFVYFGCLPKWSDHNNPKQILADFVKACLEKANRYQTTHEIAFPTLGTGYLQYPPKDAAKTIIESMKNFSDKTRKKRNIRKIYIVVYEKSSTVMEEIKAFREELANW